MQRNYTLSLLFLSVLFLSAGCSSEERPNTNTQRGRLIIVTTTGMIADAVRNIVDTTADVHALMGPGVDPHLYKATQGDLELLNKADVIFYNGLHLEGKMGEIFEKLARRKAVIPISGRIPETMLRTLSPGVHDPHIWFDIKMWEQAVHLIADTLRTYDLKNRNLFRANETAYISKLDSLHEWVYEQIHSVPEQRRVLITAHDAFGYFGSAYTIEVRGLQGISTVSEFGLRDISQLVDLIVSRKIKAVFVETSVPRRSIEAVVAGCTERGHEVRIGGSLFSDAMGPDGTPEGTYIGMVSANVQLIVSALK